MTKETMTLKTKIIWILLLLGLAFSILYLYPHIKITTIYDQEESQCHQDCINYDHDFVKYNRCTVFGNSECWCSGGRVW